MAGWDDVATPVSSPQNNNSWDSVATPVPKAPDLSGVQKMAQENMAAAAKPKETEDSEVQGPPAPPPTAAQQLDTASGMNISSALKGGDAPLSPAMRSHLVNAYKNNEATDAGGFMQNGLYGIVKEMGSAYEGAVKKLPATLAAPFLSDEQRQDLVNAGDLEAPLKTAVPGQMTGPEMVHAFAKGERETLGSVMSALYAPVSAVASPFLDPLIRKTPELAQSAGASPEWAGTIPDVIGVAMDVLGAHGAKFVGERAASIQQGVDHWDDIPGHETMKEVVGEAIGKPKEQVTSQDIDQTIAKGFKNSAPKAQDFHDTSMAMFGDSDAVDALHDIYKETGIKPDQIFTDSKSNPQIARDVSNGRIPDAYSHLIEKEGSEESGAQKPDITSKEYSQTLYDKLHEKLGQDSASDIQSMRRELEAKDALGKELDEKLYRVKEGEKLELSNQEKELYQRHIEPLARQERALYEKVKSLKGEEVEPLAEPYVHHIARGKGHYLDRYDAEFGTDEDLGFGTPRRSLSQTTGSLKEAQFHVLEDAHGHREFKAGEMPKGYKAGDKYVDEDGNSWTIRRATTAEKESNTDLQYHKSAIGNTEDNIRSLEKTIRNIEFLNGLKEDMKNTGFGIPPSEEIHPKNYQQVNIPQLRGWSFDPRIAEVLNDIYDRGGDSLLHNINNFLIKGMFLNPIPHIENVFYDYLTSRGWQNARAIKGLNYINQGIRDVKEFTPEYIEALKHGAALKLPAIWKADFFNQLERQFLSEMRDSKEGLDLAKSWGFDSVPAMAEHVFNTSQKALWGSGDAFLMAKIRELKDGGMSTKEAIEEAQKHIIDYRIPPRVGEAILGPALSRKLAQALQGNAVVVFTRYHYGLFKALGNSVKDLVTGTAGGDVAKASAAAGQLFATYLLLTVVNPAIASMWSSVTGQKEKMRNPGATGLMGAILDFASGKKSLGEALKSQFIVSPGIQVGSDILENKVVNPGLGHEGVQLMDYLMKQPTMSVPSIPYNIRAGKQDVGEEALRQIGVTPDKNYKPRKPSRKARAKLEKEQRALLGE